jgi:hypothetical protein
MRAGGRIGWALAVSLGLALSALPAAWAQSYKWTDKDGVLHFTDDPYELPEPQRTEVLRQIERERKDKNPNPETDLPPIPPEARQERLPVDDAFKLRTSPDPGSDTPAEPPAPPPESQRKFWKAKADRARAQVSELEAKCAEIETKRDEDGRKALIFATPGARAGAQKASQELESCRSSLAAARLYLEEKLPEEARKARVPPGWLE